MANDLNRRENGMGSIYQRDNGMWVGRIRTYVGTSQKSKYFSGKTEAEVRRKIREYNQALVNKETADKTSVCDYFEYWLTTYKKDTMKRSSYDRLEITFRVHIQPYFDNIYLSELTAEDVQTLINNMKAKGLSYSTVKKVYDFFNAALERAHTEEIIVRNPMRLVEMPPQKLFPKKEIRFFTEREMAAIIEECSKCYSTGKKIYLYGDVFVLMLNTGIRLGEALGLKKSDWDREKKTLHIRRNLQAVKKRDKDGNAIRGIEYVFNSTKTYSSNRVIALNNNATAALERLCATHPDSEFVACSQNGTLIPPERAERTFYFLLSNLGIEKCGTHSLRHTFASQLFAKGVDVKEVSYLLGHSTVRITYDTYIHLINKINHETVAPLDEI